MKEKFQTLKNIFEVKELRDKIIYTVILLFIYRLGTHIILPGADPASIKNLAQGDGGLLGLLNMFAGGAFSNASIFGLGVMPYISASIAVQLLAFVIPQFKKMQMEGESGRRTMNQYTRYLTILFTMFQGSAYLSFLDGKVVPVAGLSDFWFRIITMFVLTAGTMFVVWIGERITEKGIGNGVSIIIMAGILARLFSSIKNEWNAKVAADTGGVIVFLVEMILFVGVIMVVILVLQAVRRVAVQYARRIVAGGGSSVIPGRRDAPSSKSDASDEVAGSVRQYLPLKLNTAGVMPIIFAQAVMFIPGFITQMSGVDRNSEIMMALQNTQGLWYNIIVFVMVVVMTFLYTAIVMSPAQMAEDLKRNNGFIPGIKPGADTALYLDKVISLITFPGSIFLGLIAIFPYIVGMLFKVDSQWASFYGGTSLLIAVGVILDTILQIDGYLTNKRYDTLTDYNKLQGRGQVNMTTAN